MWCLLVANGRGLCDRLCIWNMCIKCCYMVRSCIAWQAFGHQLCLFAAVDEIVQHASLASPCSECCVVCCRYVGQKGISIGIDTFGASAPGPLLYEKYGITVENLVATAKKLSP